MAQRFSALLLCICMTGCKTCHQEPTPIVPVVTAPTPAPESVPEPIINMATNFSRVFFSYDSATLSSDAKMALDENAEIMSSNSDVKIEIQGHADERGTTGYNIALGQRRANAVQRYLKSKGIALSRMKVVSFGEEQPLRSDMSETAWSQNRRCEFVIVWGATDAVQGTVEN